MTQFYKWSLNDLIKSCALSFLPEAHLHTFVVSGSLLFGKQLELLILLDSLPFSLEFRVIYCKSNSMAFLNDSFTLSLSNDFNIAFI